jgi:hypothetical protein
MAFDYYRLKRGGMRCVQKIYFGYIRSHLGQQFSLWKITLPYGGFNRLKHRELVWLSLTEDLSRACF